LSAACGLVPFHHRRTIKPTPTRLDLLRLVFPFR
jgi:hypothetical protein